MKIRFLCALAIIALASACGSDDPGTGSNNDTTNNISTMDMGQPDDTGSGPEDTGGGPVDMGEAEEDMSGEMDMAEEMDMGDETDMGDEADMGGPEPYDWPATPADFVTTADRVSYIWNFGVPDVTDDVPDCCRDFGAISRTPGQADNAFAKLNAQLMPLGVGIDFQAALDEAIQTGALAFLLDHRELDGADDADGFLLSWLDGEFAAGTTYTDAAAGNGVFTIDPDSFVAGTGEPQRVMNRADMMSSVMSGGPISIDVLLPFGAASIFVPIQDMQATATANITVDSVTYAQGELSGYILEDDIFEGLNQLAASPTCSCLDLDGTEIYTESNDQWTASCVPNAQTLCPNSSEFACVVIAESNFLNNGACGILPNLIQGESGSDIELNGDDNYDALSIGLTWDAVSTTVQ